MYISRFETQISRFFYYSFSKPQGLGLEKFQRLEGLKLIHCLCICISSQRRASACLFTRSFTVAHEVENIVIASQTKSLESR